MNEHNSKNSLPEHGDRVASIRGPQTKHRFGLKKSVEPYSKMGKMWNPPN